MLPRLGRVVALLALLLTCEPLLHNHPLQRGATTSGGNTCAVCVSGAHRLPSSAPAIAPPQRVIAVVMASDVIVVGAAAPLPRDSRAPPAAA